MGEDMKTDDPSAAAKDGSTMSKREDLINELAEALDLSGLCDDEEARHDAAVYIDAAIRLGRERVNEDSPLYAAQHHFSRVVACIERLSRRGVDVGQFVDMLTTSVGSVANLVRGYELDEQAEQGNA